MIPPSIIAFFARPAIRMFALLGAIGLVLLGMWAIVHAFTANPKAEARLSKNQTEAATANGKDAVGVVGANAASEAASADLTRTNADTIRAAPGAGARVDDGVNAAGLAALCRRAAYRDTAHCKRVAP